MNLRIIKPIAGGILLGVAMFFIPFFVLRVATFLIILGIVLRYFAGRPRVGSRLMYRRMAFADRIRNMNEEEYNRFKAGFAGGCGFEPQSSSGKNDK